MNSIDFSHRENSEDDHHDCKNACRGVTNSPRQVRAFEDKLCGNENDQIEDNEEVTLGGKVILLLIVYCSEFFWN